MRICIVSDSYYPHLGGVTEHIRHTADELRRLGHCVDILTASYGNNRGYEAPEIVRVGRSVKIPYNKSFATVTIGLDISAKVGRVLTRRDYDIVHTHGPLAPTLPLLALRNSKSINIATFHTAHSNPPQAYHVLRSYFDRYYFRKIHGLIAVSTVARDCMYRYFPGDYRIIPNGVDVERFKVGLKPIDRLRDSSHNVLFVGRFDPRKGLKYLLLAFPMVVKQCPEAKLIVVGGGPLKPYYERFIDFSVRDRVLFQGSVAPDDLPLYYASCDVFCSPATGAESFGIILLEAMSSGKPIVASDIHGYRQVIEDGVDGILVPPEDPGALASSIVKVLKSRGLRARLSENGLRKSKRYSWERVTKTIEGYYYEVRDRVERRASI